MAAYPQFRKQIEAHKALHYAIDQLKLDVAFQPKHAERGLTVLLPLRGQQLFDERYLVDSERRLLSLVIPDYVPNAAAAKNLLQSGGPGIGCRHGTKLAARIANGHLEFRMMGDDPKEKEPRYVRAVPKFAEPESGLAILELQGSGFPEITNDAYTPPARVSGQPAPRVIDESRLRLAKQAERDFLACFERGTAWEVYLAKVVGLLNFLKAESRDTVYPRALAVLDRCPFVSFYILVEPYATSNQPVVPDALISAWGGTEVFQNASTELLAACNSAKAMMANGAELTAAVQSRERDQLWGAGVGTLITKLSAAYQTVYGEHGAARLRMDFFRHCISKEFSRFQYCRPASRRQEFMKLINRVEGWQPILLIAQPHEIAAHSDRHDALRRFVLSTDFLYKPSAPGQSLPDAKPDEKAKKYDRTPIWEHYLDSIACRGTVQQHGLPASALAAVHVYLRCGGKLPSELVTLVTAPKPVSEPKPAPEPTAVSAKGAADAVGDLLK